MFNYLLILLLNYIFPLDAAHILLVVINTLPESKSVYPFIFILDMPSINVT